MTGCRKSRLFDGFNTNSGSKFGLRTDGDADQLLSLPLHRSSAEKFIVRADRIDAQRPRCLPHCPTSPGQTTLISTRSIDSDLLLLPSSTKRLVQLHHRLKFAGACLCKRQFGRKIVCFTGQDRKITGRTTAIAKS